MFLLKGLLAWLIVFGSFVAMFELMLWCRRRRERRERGFIVKSDRPLPLPTSDHPGEEVRRTFNGGAH